MILQRLFALIGAAIYGLMILVQFIIQWPVQVLLRIFLWASLNVALTCVRLLYGLQVGANFHTRINKFLDSIE